MQILQNVLWEISFVSDKIKGVATNTECKGVAAVDIGKTDGIR